MMKHFKDSQTLKTRIEPQCMLHVIFNRQWFYWSHYYEQHKSSMHVSMDNTIHVHVQLDVSWHLRMMILTTRSTCHCSGLYRFVPSLQ